MCDDTSRPRGSVSGTISELEKWFIEYYDSRNPEKVYNRFTGGARKGAQNSELSKELNRRACLKKAEDPEICSLYRQRALDYYAAHPEAKERVSRQMLAYLQTPEGRKFAESAGTPKPVRCVETGVVYPSQKAAERATGFTGIHKACSGKQVLLGGYHWVNV